VHSDDGNETISGKDHKLTKMEKNFFIKLSNYICLPFSLSWSKTKISISLGKGGGHIFKEDNFKEKFFSELVSIYNVSGTMYNSMVRQSADVLSSATYESFSMNHLAIITRACQAYACSNSIIFPTILYFEMINYLKELYFPNSKDRIYNKTLQWGGDLACSIRAIAKFGIHYDQVTKYIHYPDLITYQTRDVISENAIIRDSKAQVKFLETGKIKKHIISVKHDNSISSKYFSTLTDLIASMGSGVFLKPIHLDNFNFYKKKTARVLSKFSSRRDQGDKSKFSSEDIRFGPTEMETMINPRLNEFVAGSQDLLSVILADYKSHKNAMFRDPVIGGYVSGLELSGMKLILTDFNDALLFLLDPVSYSANPLLSHNLDVVMSDIRNFSNFTGINTIEEFEISSNKWDIIKRVGYLQTRVLSNQFGSNIYSDCVFEVLEETGDEHLNQYKFISDFVNYKPAGRNLNLQVVQDIFLILISGCGLNHSDEQMSKSIKKELLKIPDYGRGNFIATCGNKFVRYLSSYFYSMPIKNLSQVFFVIDYNEETDTTVYQINMGKPNVAYSNSEGIIFFASNLGVNQKRFLQKKFLKSIEVNANENSDELQFLKEMKTLLIEEEGIVTKISFKKNQRVQKWGKSIFIPLSLDIQFRTLSGVNNRVIEFELNLNRLNVTQVKYLSHFFPTIKSNPNFFRIWDLRSQNKNKDEISRLVKSSKMVTHEDSLSLIGKYFGPIPLSSEPDSELVQSTVIKKLKAFSESELFVCFEHISDKKCHQLISVSVDSCIFCTKYGPNKTVLAKVKKKNKGRYCKN